MSNQRNWPRETLEEFILLYKSFPSLWKIKDSSYKNRTVKNAAYDELVKFCKMNVNPDANREFVFKKIQTLRGSFRKELKKIVDSIRSGAGQEEVHKPGLWYFNLLLFTKDQEDVKMGINSVAKTIEENNLEEVGTDEFYNEQESQSYDALKIEEKIKVPEEINCTTCFGHQKKRKQRQEKNTAFIEICQKLVQENNPEVGEFEAIGINVAKKLQRMNATQAIYAEDLINKVLRKGLLGKLSENTDVCDTVNSSKIICSSSETTQSEFES